MKPADWLLLSKAHIDNPSSLSEEEMAQLRSNYKVWNGAIEYWKQEERDAFFKVARLVTGGLRFPDEHWKALLGGQEIPELQLSEENMVRLVEARVIFLENMATISASGKMLRFLKKFDEEYEAQHGSSAPELQEIFWKTKAEGLARAIHEHRRAHVLANKEPNGLDFALWSEIDEDEFHASTHAGFQATGKFTFRE